MSIRRLFTILAATALVVAFAQAAAAGDRRPSRYAGTSRTTTVDPVDLSFTATNRVEGGGRSGRFVLEGLEEWQADLSITCPRAADLPIRLIEGGSVVTYRNLRDQVMLVAEEGHICLDIHTSKFTGEQRGTIAGGTGRFARATGTYVTRFEGEDVLTDLSRLAGRLTLKLEKP
jgi:hypothetical protein